MAAVEFLRVPHHHYEDPLSVIWIHCAKSIGFKIQRTEEVYASTDGLGTLWLATHDQFDPDDHLGQIIFHELCHALVEGEAGEKKMDWGLDNTRMGTPWREHAALRLQAHLSQPWGLRNFMAPTTDFRVTFWNQLPEDPFEAPEAVGGRLESSVVAARKAAQRARHPRFRVPLEEAFKATQRIGEILKPLSLRTPPVSKRSDSDALMPLWSTPVSPLAMHPSGYEYLPGHDNPHRCNECAWHLLVRGTLRCRHRPRRKLSLEVMACRGFEPGHALDCQTCGACCREAYDSVEISRNDPIHQTHPELVVVRPSHYKLLREGQRCAALEGGQNLSERYRCRIYADRPGTCRDFEAGGPHCLEARRRVGLTL